MSEHVFKLPDLGEGAVEAEIVEWLVQPGDRVREGDPIACILTDKANVEMPAPVDGLVLRTSGQAGETVAVGAELAAFEIAESGPVPEAGQTPAGQAPPAPPSPPSSAAVSPLPSAAVSSPPSAAASSPQDAPPAKRILTSPAIRRRAKESGLDLAQVQGSGPGGRILAGDLDAYLARQARPSPEAAARPESSARREPAAAQNAEEAEEIKPTGVRRAIARRMVQSKREIPHFTYVEEVDVTELQALRRHLREQRPEEPPMSLLPFICRGLIRALADFPQCNATYDAQAEVLRRHRAVHLGLAVHTAEGLKVPVVRNAQRLGFRALAAAIARVAQGARENRLPPEDLKGSSITLSSLGKLGGIVSTPILNYPEVAIVGVNRAVQRPAVRAGQVAIRSLMNLSSSFDHRFVDGQDAAAMIQRLKTLLEHPAALFMPKD